MYEVENEGKIMSNQIRRKKKRATGRMFLLLCVLVLLLLLAFFTIKALEPVKDTVTVEAGSSAVEVAEFLKKAEEADQASFQTDISTIDFTKPGIYPVEILLNGKAYSSEVKVVDTVAPKGIAQDATAWLGNELAPEAILKSVEDATEVTAAWVKAPDVNTEGRQEVTIRITDAGGNSQELSAAVTVKKDDEPPVIKGAVNLGICLGETVSYRKNVTVTDNCDREVELKVDSSKVDLKKLGEYPVVYSATDKSGNTATVEITLTISDISSDEVNALADKVLEEITTPEMTKKEICRAIYDWGRKKIAYVGTSDKSSVWRGAYDGFTKLRGDCYTYYAVATVLFDRLGIPNMMVERVGGTERHYWCLVDIGEGWYHFDCSPRRKGYYIDTCLVPDSVLEDYSKNKIPGYYDFDHSLYPERGK